mmetsp:Transcript_28799/g.66995  ORF Transcript_28799/g.66995 Transcript_28799/m.66995 type:complete len:172 (-) Transcript_28799:54-569(-)
MTDGAEDDYVVRGLQRDDFNKGYKEVLAQLTDVGELTQAVFEDVFDDQQQKGIYRTVVAEHMPSGKIAGGATLILERKFVHGGAVVGHVEDVVVDSQHRRKGLAGRMMMELERLARDDDKCYKVILDCKESNAVVYEKCGYRKCEIQMRLDLTTPATPCWPPDLQSNQAKP